MLLPRAFRYSQAQAAVSEKHNEQRRESRMRRSSLEKSQADPRREGITRPPARPGARRFSSSDKGLPSTASSKPVTIPSTRSSSRSSAATIRHASSGNSTSLRSRSTRSAAHRQDALPPSVAALLAVTAIPARRSQPNLRGSSNTQARRISGDELVREWRQEAAIKPVVGSHKSMDVLLEDLALDSDAGSLEDIKQEENASTKSRSDSCESLPSLDQDEQSLLSFSHPQTPDHFRLSGSSNLSTSTKKRTRPRAPPASFDSSDDHPLIPSTDPDPEMFAIDTINGPQDSNKTLRKSSRSNLTAAFQAIKSKAFQSLSNFSKGNSLSQSGVSPGYAFSDALLWQHPFMFPRIGPEIRPEPFIGVPSESQRRYLNPPTSPPLNFDEQQGDYCQALHSPLHLESDFAEYAPMIKMQTYNPSSRSSSSKRRRSRGANSSPDPNTEAGRALTSAGPPLARQREPRENSNFLRVIVLEMNMRRKGKLEENVPGRATIWLPPRKVAVGGGCRDGRGGASVPRRWVGVGVDDI